MRKRYANGTLKLLTENMHSAVLPLTKETFKSLVQKHLETKEPFPDILIQGPARPIYPVVYGDMDESEGFDVSMETFGTEF